MSGLPEAVGVTARSQKQQSPIAGALLCDVGLELCGLWRFPCAGWWSALDRMKTRDLAETVRFELTDGCPSAVFKTAGLNHSPKSPPDLGFSCGPRHSTSLPMQPAKAHTVRDQRHKAEPQRWGFVVSGFVLSHHPPLAMRTRQQHPLIHSGDAHASWNCTFGAQFRCLGSGLSVWEHLLQ